MSETLKEKALKEGVPIIKDEGLAFLLNIIEERNCRDILELGTAVGYSAIQMAKMDKCIHVDTLEKNEELYREAVKNIADNGLSDQITPYLIAIEDFRTDKLYDLIFVDAAKAQYGKYLEMFLDNLKSDGIMVFDNMVFHGLIYDPESIRSRNLRNLVKKIVKFREKVHNDERFDIMMFDNIGDGIFVLTRRNRET
ncbi:MAG: class I SAM-dependent methyltransferase [Erysipelotrichaceae bacterium]|nr:class I SAM-dependent methyltransferase [Erysipelotrichaceae bacterium]MBQ1534014.1 class I SAM-dependent methyltransferase [Erysipelotrichaceae bacterium]MBQ5804905.1 class I SAM-dependent methyltransferase [Erysipelotrichaceae bacterium]